MVKIFIVTQEEYFYLPRFLRTVIEARKKDLVGITILPVFMPNSSWYSTARDHLHLYGLKTFLFQSFRLGLHRSLNLMSKGFSLGRFFSVTAVARYYSIPIFSTDNINNKGFLQTLRELEPDIIVSINASQIFKREILDLPKLGCINVHGALLPRYRGRLPSFWVLANGETETGVTVHYMNEYLDDGPIILQRKIPISQSDTHHSLLKKTKNLGAELLLESLTLIERGAVRITENNRALATYYSFPQKEDGERFKRSGRRFV